jgi:hypothetical protein
MRMFGRDPVVDDQHRHTGGLRVRAHQAVANREQQREETAAVWYRTALPGRSTVAFRYPDSSARRHRGAIGAPSAASVTTSVRSIRGTSSPEFASAAIYIAEILAAALDISDGWPGFSGEGTSTQTGKNLGVHLQGHGDSSDLIHKFPIFLIFTDCIDFMALRLASDQAHSDSGRGGIQSTALRSAQWRPKTGSETADG